MGAATNSDPVTRAEAKIRILGKVKDWKGEGFIEIHLSRLDVPERRGGQKCAVLHGFPVSLHLA
jgi:hypothetical protein